MRAKQCHEFWSRCFCLPIFPFFCYKMKIADVKKVWKPVTAMGRSPSVYRMPWSYEPTDLCGGGCYLKAGCCPGSKYLVLAKDGVSKSLDYLMIGYPSLQAPIFHLIVFTLHSKPSLLSRNAYHASICRHAAKPQSLPVSVPVWVWESGRSPNSRWVSQSPGLTSTGCLLSP